jgi:hypothetical protein
MRPVIFDAANRLKCSKFEAHLLGIIDVVLVELDEVGVKPEYVVQLVEAMLKNIVDDTEAVQAAEELLTGG